MLLGLRRHPPGLYSLCLVELFERLASYATLPLFTLYLNERHGHAPASAIALASGFVAASYLASLPGGLVADRIGACAAMRLGALLLFGGFVGLAGGWPALLWPSLFALLAGSGLFKPSISALVGKLYPAGDERREAGFAIFYVAVNLGALGGPLLAEWSRARWGWPAIFVCAASAMAAALWASLFTVGPTQQAADENFIASASHSDERPRIKALYLLCGAGVASCVVFQQTGTSLAFFAEQDTRLRLGSSLVLRPGHFAALHAAFVILFTPLLHRTFAWLRARRVELSISRKIIGGFLFLGAAFLLVSAADLTNTAQRKSPLWLANCYGLLSLGELLLSPMSLAFLSRIAPPRLAGRCHGLWYAAVAVGYGLAAAVGPLWTHWPHHRYFAAIAVISFISAAWLLLCRSTLEASISRQ